ncbi:Putative transporter [Tolypocladium paradoxum]|uniref:Transporter n=1 Tax=Tolypocladium paradoxum TaxID=94208 RepID=A0A2S4KUG6_9HYPO|nr:Putative transporter [Tolypocladium paradoxum]
MLAPGVPQLMREFGSASPELASFCVSVYVLGLAAGPMAFAPLSELYGRPVVYHVTNAGFLAFIVACAKAPSLSTLIAFRFLSGVFGSCPLTNGGGTIADMIVQEKRGAAMASYAVGPLIGPIVGPVVGGVVSEALGWRWVFWIIAIVSGVLSLCFLCFCRETYAPVILQQKVDRLRRETGNGMLRSRLDAGLAPRDFFKRGILRPFKMLLFSPICIICNVFVGLAYGYLYLLFTSLTPLFMRIYHFDTVHAGLAFLGLGVGSMVGVAYFSVASDSHIRNKAAQEAAAAAATDTPNGAGRFKPTIKPEYRLPPLKVGALLLPAGFFIYGWTAEYSVHWIAPIIGTAIIGVGNLIVFMVLAPFAMPSLDQTCADREATQALQLYLVDSFTIYAASALAANAVVRSVAGAVLPLAGIPMYDKLGLGWGNSLLGLIAIIMLPAPWLFLKYGEYLRKRFEIKNL